jgi:hypothetical protein
MKIAIISDVHNNDVNLKKVLRYCAQNSVEKIICCGDLADMKTLDILNDNFSGDIFFTFGNMDNDHLRDHEFDKKYKHTFIFRKFGETGIDSKQVAFIHFPREAKELAETGKYDFVFNGHTHKPWTEKVGTCTLLNPGNVTGDFYPPTFAVWNTTDDKFELIRIHNLR